MFNTMELGQITLESVLIIVIVLITLNLLFIGFYILSVLKELKRTLTRARGMMEEVDRSVKSGMDKFIAIERPLEALSTTTNALAGFLKGSNVIKKATQSMSILSSNAAPAVETTDYELDNTIDADFAPEDEIIDEPAPVRPQNNHAKAEVPTSVQSKVNVRGAQTEDEPIEAEAAPKKNPVEKKAKKPRFFSR